MIYSIMSSSPLALNVINKHTDIIKLQCQYKYHTVGGLTVLSMVLMSVPLAMFAVGEPHPSTQT